MASTKAYMTMLVGEYLLALALGGNGGNLDPEVAAGLVAGFADPAPGGRGHSGPRGRDARRRPASFAGHDDFYFIARGIDFAVATEGALKMKEISYIHSEGMPAGELKHGTLALVAHGTPIVVVLTQTAVYDKTIAAPQEAKARGAFIVALGTRPTPISPSTPTGDPHPPGAGPAGPGAGVVPLQLLAYYVAVFRGHDIDQPRNLAKSVTVE